MKTATLIGIFLLFLGIGALAYQAYSYTGHGEILELGPSGASAESRTIPVPPVVGVLGVIGGAALLWATARSRRPITR